MIFYFTIYVVGTRVAYRKYKIVMKLVKGGSGDTGICLSN